jgi:ornithine cyclodeaminase
MSIHFRLLTEPDVKSVLTMDDLIETMTSALRRFSTGRVVQPVRPTIPIADDSFFATMPAYVRGTNSDGVRRGSDPGPDPRLTPSTDAAALGAKLVTVFGGNAVKGLHSHLASIVLLDPETGAILGTGVQARSHLDALSRIHRLRQVTVWSPNREHRKRFVDDAMAIKSTSERDRVGTGSASDGDAMRIKLETPYAITAVDHAGEAVVGADIIVLVTASPTPVLESGWVKPGAHVICVGACRPTQREMDPDLVARARLFVDSRAAALVESGDVVMGIQEGRFSGDHIVAELGELIAGTAPAGRRTDTEITVFKSLGLAVEDVTAADLAYRRAAERGVGQELTL